MDLNYLKNLIAIALADGVIEANELDMLKESATEVGISQAELNSLIKNASAYTPDIPENRADREKHLIKMISIATADGNFTQEEFELCKIIADKMEYKGFSEALRVTMNKSYLKNLVVLACADGVIDDSEMKILKEAAIDAGISESELQHLIVNSDSFKHLIPESEEDRETQLVQMISLAIADGEFTAEEFKLCKLVASRLGFSEDELRMIIRLSFKGQAAVD